MITANQELTDALIRHQIFLLRYSAKIRNRIFDILNATEVDVAQKIKDRLGANVGLDTAIEVRRMETLIKLLTAIREKAWGKVEELLKVEMVELAYNEPKVYKNLIDTTMPVKMDVVLPQANLLRSIALTNPFEGRILKDWASKMKEDDIARISNSIRMGMVAGEDMATITRRVIGTATDAGASGILEQTRTQVQAVVRTAVMSISNNARNRFISDNADIVTTEQFVATLDSRTTPICRANDGKQFPIGKGPRPPLHFNCRSLRIAVIDGTLVGDRPAKPVTERMLVREYAKEQELGDLTNRDDLPRGYKTDYDAWARGRIRELIGPVPAHETYQTWLMRQSIEFQNEILGIQKAQLFRKGGLTLDKFVDRNGNELNLHELAKKHASAFKAAGLNPADY